MLSPQLKVTPTIFVAVRDLTLIVKGQTRKRCKALGYEGMQFKWERDLQQWHVSPEVWQAMDEFREAERERREYYGRR